MVYNFSATKIGDQGRRGFFVGSFFVRRGRVGSGFIYTKNRAWLRSGFYVQKLSGHKSAGLRKRARVGVWEVLPSAPQANFFPTDINEHHIITMISNGNNVIFIFYTPITQL